MIRKSLETVQIIDLLNINYGIEAQSAMLLNLGADINAAIYKVNTKSACFFVKIKYGIEQAVHLDIVNLLHDSGIKEIICPIATLDEKFLVQLDNFQIIVYPFIEAKNGFEQKLTRNQWVELGGIFKKIHSLSLPSSIKQQLRKETFSSKWRKIVQSFYLQIEPEMTDDIITTNFKNLFKKKLDTIYQLISSAEQLSKKLNADANKYVLCHSDIHAGNVLIKDNENFYIIDWDNPIMAPKERDLMFIGGGVGNVWNSSAEVAYFYQGYDETNIDHILLSYYRYERIIEDIAEFSQDILFHDHNDQSKLVSFKHFKSMFEANGVVDIAFNSEVI